jgi:hypothetical protein
MRKMGAKTAAIRALTPLDAEVKEECLALRTYYDEEIPIEISKIFFFYDQLLEAEAHQLETIDGDHLLAVATIINFERPINGANLPKSYIYSATVAVPLVDSPLHCRRLPLLNNYLHIAGHFSCGVPCCENKTRQFMVKGTFFCQQNGVTSVCAHSALRMTINNMVSPSIPISSEDINRVVGIDHVSDKIGFGDRKGLSVKEMTKVCRHFGLSYIVKNFGREPTLAYNDYIYKYIESRCPVILGFSTKGSSHHVVPILGHTLNTDMWRPEAEPAYTIEEASRFERYKSASAWVDHFLINDDNFGMYFCMPVESLKNRDRVKPKSGTKTKGGHDADQSFTAELAVIVLPSASVTTAPWEPEWASIKILEKTLAFLQVHDIAFDHWTERIVSSILVTPPRPLVLRTFLVRKQEYSESLCVKDFEGNEFTPEDKELLLANLPELFWLSEMTLPDLYTANKTKIIDFYYGCNYPALKEFKEIEDRWIQIRFPGALFRQQGAELRSEALSVKSHYPLLRFKSDTTLEW